MTIFILIEYQLNSKSESSNVKQKFLRGTYQHCGVKLFELHIQIFYQAAILICRQIVMMNVA